MDSDTQMAPIKQNENAQRWVDAKVIHYHIVGVYQGKPYFTSDPGKGSGFADVTERVEIDLDWKLSESKLVGTPRIQNSKSVVKNPHDSERSCLPPVLKGEYEHYDLLGIKEGLGGALELQVQTTYLWLKSCSFVPAAVSLYPRAARLDPKSWSCRRR